MRRLLLCLVLLPAAAAQERFPHQVEAEELTLFAEDGSPRAHIFHVDYVWPGRAGRPVTFVFNGGPGSSSVWLHLGAFGPQRVAADPEGFRLPPPGRLVENAETLLPLTDLVFIDPVTTGFSRAAEGVEPSEFHGLEEDAAAVAEFIRRWISDNDRWDSPKYLCGESYGTTRAAEVTGVLQAEHGIYLNGVVLVSSVLQFQTLRFHPGNDLPYALFLPTYAATAHYHGRVPGELEDLLSAAEEYALGEYTLALAKGSRLTPSERAEVAAKLAGLTGLDPEVVLANDLRIRIDRFVKDLRRDERVTVGRLDSRFVGKDRDAGGEGYEFDPSYAAIQGPFTAAVNTYLREDLGVEKTITYEILTGRVHPWRFPEGRYVDVADTLRREMRRNPHLRVFVANGRYDLATPYFATKYTFDHLDIEGDLNERVTMRDYDSGHMMYIRDADRVALRRDLGEFYE